MKQNKDVEIHNAKDEKIQIDIYRLNQGWEKKTYFVHVGNEFVCINLPKVLGKANFKTFGSQSTQFKRDTIIYHFRQPFTENQIEYLSGRN